MRFKITWRDGAYYVNVPEYNGGEVVTADDFDDALWLLAEAADLVAGGTHEARIDEFIRRHGIERDAIASSQEDE